ncbi:hypothetical protein [Gelidibacter pelagius]|uniref:Uncharacterized protein n=1 Tax=Gelidibacter pelagius TaxID=2819985 RepID=A0ABS3SSA2_9FLAO|nr:hypothetical protein [Gelidibacter pelagius]MBO3097822.1 hypothetical protein [Gelidibacter pelagius]
MREFKENEDFIASIKDNDIYEIKRTLIDNIFFLQGNKNEIKEAVEYTILNSDFNFEEHKVLEVSDKTNKEDCFSDEKWNLRENFSKQRYDLLVELYNETFAKKEFTYESGTTSNNENNDLLKKVMIGGVVLIAGYLIYKALS